MPNPNRIVIVTHPNGSNSNIIAQTHSNLSTAAYRSHQASGALETWQRRVVNEIINHGPATWFELEQKWNCEGQGLWKYGRTPTYHGIFKPEEQSNSRKNPKTGKPCIVWEWTGKIPTDADFQPPPEGILKDQVMVNLDEANRTIKILREALQMQNHVIQERDQVIQEREAKIREWEQWYTRTYGVPPPP